MTIESLSNERLSSFDDRPLIDREGENEWRETYKIKNGELDAAREHFVAGRENILPGHSKADTYAPCVVSVEARTTEEFPEHHVVSVLYRRPSPGMILQPGRAMLSLDTYTTTVREEYPVVMRRETAIPLAHITVPDLNKLVHAGVSEPIGPISDSPPPPQTLAGGALVKKTATVRTGTRLLIRERVALVIAATDWAVNLNTVATRAEQWKGKGGELTIYGKKWNNLKCSRVLIRPRGSNASILDSTWTFVQNDEGWSMSGARGETFMAFDGTGKELDCNPTTGLITRPPSDSPARPPASPYAPYAPDPSEGLAARLVREAEEAAAGDITIMSFRTTTTDVISGYADFSALEDYFKWMKVGG